MCGGLGGSSVFCGSKGKWRLILHKLSHVVIKTDNEGNPVTAMMLGLTKRQTLHILRGGKETPRAGITKNKGRKRNEARVKMARESQRRNRA